ncbi:transcriptional regulator [Bacillus cereus]|uniref:Transcriptional regulator n=1 Tax=Bacillus cereus TaxID=1396 RepID=A0A2B0MLU7_BACCE|nr:transcriptional regulator [Bacillus cereus]
MSDISVKFWDASIEELKKGYIFEEDTEEYICLACGEKFIKGVIYQNQNVLYEAEKFVQLHIENEHTSMFEYLLNLDKKFTGLTDLQKKMVQFFYMGLNDKEIVKEMEGGSTSTIRNHRFTLREKMKQAKVFLALMELSEEKSKAHPKFLPIHRTATMVDDRYNITEDENDEVLKLHFTEGLDGPLVKFPKKQKRKLIILRHLVKKFDSNKKYTEKEVNQILENVYSDFVTLRRYLIEYGFLDRTADGSKYWVKL